MSDKFQEMIREKSFTIAYFLYVISLMIGLTTFKDVNNMTVFQDVLRNLSYIFLVFKIFIDFYSKQKNDTFSIDDAVRDSYEGNKFRNDMFCPECRQAQLTLVAETSKHRAYLKRIPSSSHQQGCSFIYKYVTNRVIIKKYIDSLTKEQLQDKLDSIMRLLCKPQLIHDNLEATNANDKNIKVSPMLIPVNEQHVNNLNALRRKKIGSYIDKLDEGVVYVFYGTVRLEMNCIEKKDPYTKEEYKMSFLNVYSLNKNNEWKKRASLYQGKKSLHISELIILYCFHGLCRI